MVAVKGKLGILLSQNEDYGTKRKARVKEFKVYDDNENTEVSSSGSNGTQQKSSFLPPRRKSVTFSGRSTQTMTNNLKGGTKVSENQKGKRDSSISVNVGRRALADVSNLRRNSLKPNVQDGRKQLETVRKAPTIMRKSLLVSNTVSKVETTAKKEKGKMIETRRPVLVAYSTLKRGSRDVKPSTSDQRSHTQGHECLNVDGRIISRKPRPLSRKSLPGCKLSHDIGNKKEHGDNIDKSIKGAHSYSGKANIGQKVIPEVKNTRPHLWRTRASDGFIIMNSKNQSAANGIAFPRKSLKPIVKATRGTFKDKVSLKSKDREEALSDCSSNTSKSMLEKDAPKKARRRKSFTSLLMGSKVQDEKGQCLEQKLPNIYDEKNHIEVPEYVDAIYQHYWTMEAQNDSLENYMETQTEITFQMRDILVNWLIEVHIKFDLMPETLYLTITLLDRYLSLVTIKRNELQLVGLTAVLLASKYEDFWHPRVSDLISISVDSYTRDQMLRMEKAFLKTLKFRLNAPTPYVFMLRFLKASQSDKKLEDLSFYLIDICMVHYEALRFKYSLLCASAIYVARCTLQMTPSWSKLLCIYTHYEESQLRDCAEMVLKFQKSAKTSKLKVTFEKYSKPEHSQVANIRPLNKLPFN